MSVPSRRASDRVNLPRWNTARAIGVARTAMNADSADEPVAVSNDRDRPGGQVREQDLFGDPCDRVQASRHDWPDREPGDGLEVLVPEPQRGAKADSVADGE